MKLWLWKNFVDGKPEYWAFDNPFPVHLDCGDPQTLGEPCGYAIFKESRNGRPDVTEAEVLRRIAADVLEADDAQVLRATAQVNKLNADIERLHEKIQAIGDYAASRRTSPALREAMLGIEELCVEALTPNAECGGLDASD